MLDVAPPRHRRPLGRRGSSPAFDYLVVENTLGKYGERVDVLTTVPVNVQGLVGKG